MHPDDFGFGTQIRKSPFFNATVRWGAQGFSVYNHMYIPRDFGNPERNFWTLVNDAILCDVAVERQRRAGKVSARREGVSNDATADDLDDSRVGGSDGITERHIARVGAADHRRRRSDEQRCRDGKGCQ